MSFSVSLSRNKPKSILDGKIGVWWDINTCPVPKGIEPCSVRRRIEWVVWKTCHYRPISIFCVGDLERVDPRVLKALSSSGIILRHVPSFGWSSALCDHLRDWKERTFPGAFLLLISGDMSWFTGSWFNSSILSLRFNIVRAFPAPRPPGYPSYKEWVWEELLLEARSTEPNIKELLPNYADEHAWFCSLCEIPSQSCDEFIKHLNSDKHKDELASSVLMVVDENNVPIRQEQEHGCLPTSLDLSYNLASSVLMVVDENNFPIRLAQVGDCLPTSLDLSENMSRLSVPAFHRALFHEDTTPHVYPGQPIGVWWDINTCPIPDGYDPGRVRWSIESALQAYIGHACPVTISCVGNLEFISPEVLKEISSSGIFLGHTILRGTAFTSLLRVWEEHNPPPAKIMLISADETWFSSSRGYTILRALPDPQSFPSCMSTHVWAWKSLLTCSQSEILLEDTNSRKDDEFELCFCTVCRIPSQSCEAFIKHLKSTSHAKELWKWVRLDENNIPRFFCKTCNYPGYDFYNMKIHWTSEEHAQKAKVEILKKKMERECMV